MDELPAQISLQMNRFLMIQNAVEDAEDHPSATISRNLVSTRLDVLESNWNKFQEEHERLCRVHAGRLTDESYIRSRTYERCQEFYVQARSILLDQQDSVEASNSSARSCGPPSSEGRSGTRLRSLPRISLPTFSGEFHAWKDFSDLFTSMVGENPELTNVEKMQYLKTCLAGDAARRVANLKVTNATFNLAWKTLESRYDNKRILIAAQVDSLLDLKPIKSKSAQDLNDMMITVTHALGALEALDCPVKEWDAFLVRMLARLLDEDTREDWNIHLGSSTASPTLKAFEEFVNSRTQAWEKRSSEQGKPTKDKKRTSWLSGKADVRSRSLVATASTAKGGIECRLCKAAHYLSNCSTYLSYALERRKRTVIRFHLCFNCLGSHGVGRCPSSHRCRKCGSKHHTTLHDDRRTQSKTATKADPDVSTVSESPPLVPTSEQK
ncbi:PREDICTED: uncharacterized protein LOC105568923 [Vollenhovia emeryi]|uniref:uncharacterized protein LOC105568923 n=1 Tax=Vollenhovia emeryi TaxID=411798 RepID=UPI0005F574B3|nr:PREDICTED: uncharacterized protein LOC105568923 [Vollenhovia emeryi]